MILIRSATISDDQSVRTSKVNRRSTEVKGTSNDKREGRPARLPLPPGCWTYQNG